MIHELFPYPCVSDARRAIGHSIEQGSAEQKQQRYTMSMESPQ